MNNVKPSAEQIKVLRSLVQDGSAAAYYKGGFWASKGQAITEPNGAPERWFTSIQTIRVLEKRGWIRSVPGTAYNNLPGLEMRKVTEEGRFLVENEKSGL